MAIEPESMPIKSHTKKPSILLSSDDVIERCLPHLLLFWNVF